jgi:hypothetical protein
MIHGVNLDVFGACIDPLTPVADDTVDALVLVLELKILLVLVVP